MNHIICKLNALIFALLLSGPLLFGIDKSELVAIYPKTIPNKGQLDNQGPGTAWPIDPLYPLQHVDEIAEYYLGSGNWQDTFFVVFEPAVACSVKFAEIQWHDWGNANAFAAWYSDEAQSLYPGGSAPNRGESPVSPIGEWITDPAPNSALGSGNWELLDLGGYEFICGNPETFETDQFGIGFIKGSEMPHPRADRMDSKGIRETHTWFGGPWMATYPHDWGAYSSDLQNSVVIEVMMRVWVTYPWEMPILISDLSQKSNTFDTIGGYYVECRLEDDEPGINEVDQIQLHYSVNGDYAGYLDLEETAAGSGMYCTSIPGQNVNSEIQYWVECIDEAGLVSTSLIKEFQVIAPERPDADLLLIDDGLDDRFTAYWWALDNLGYYSEYWNVEENMGIDAAVINYGWNTIIAAGWGISSIPCLDEDNPYTGFLDGGGNLAIIDQDWFYAQGLPAIGNFTGGDFACDYFGVNEYYNDFTPVETNYSGVYGSEISNYWYGNSYQTYWDNSGIHMHPSELWADYFTLYPQAEMLFFGETDENTYGCSYENGFKTVFLSFMAEANCEISSSGYWTPGEDFTALLGNILNWFGTLEVEPVIELSANTFSLNQNYPNPFNAETTISFSLPAPSEIDASIYNIEGKLVETIFDGQKSGGLHNLKWNAVEFTSGIYFCRINSQFGSETMKLLLVK